MKLAIILVAVLAALYIILILAPAITFYKVIFTKRRYKNANFEELNENNKYFSFYPDRLKRAADFIHTLKRENFRFCVKDGTAICGAIYSADSNKTAVFLHGYNTAPLNNFCLQAEALYGLGFNIVFVYQRSHGKSTGTSTMGIKEQDDLLEIIPFIKKQTNAEQLLIYGMSMGCTALAYSSDRLDGGYVKGIVLDCGFTSPYIQLKREMTRRRLPVFLIAPLLTFFTKFFLKIDIKKTTEDSLKNCKVPALFLHGSADVTVPADDSRKNFNACGAQKTLYIAPKAEHTLCYPSGNEAETLLLKFIKKYFE